MIFSLGRRLADREVRLEEMAYQRAYAGWHDYHDHSDHHHH